MSLKETITSETTKWFSRLKRLGRNSAVPVALLWLFDFHFVRQGTEIALTRARSDWNGLRAIVSETMSKMGYLVLATFFTSILAYWLGRIPIGWFFVAIYFICFTALTLYTGGMAVAISFALQVFGFGKGDKEAPVVVIWRIFRHTLYWVCLFILLNLMAKPWEEGRFETFLILCLSELALFLLNEFTRRVVRIASAVVTTIVGACAFCLIIVIFVKGKEASAPISNKFSDATVALVDGGADFWDAGTSLFKQVGQRWKNGADRIPTLPNVERILDVNGDDKLDSLDTNALFYVVQGLRPATTVTIDDRIYQRGDYDGDGVVTFMDSDALDDYIINGKQGPAPADMKSRKAFRGNNQNQNGKDVNPPLTEQPPPNGQPLAKPQQMAQVSLPDTTKSAIQPGTFKVNRWAPRQPDFKFLFQVKSVEVAEDRILVKVVWDNCYDYFEVAGCGSATHLIDDRGNILKLVGLESNKLAIDHTRHKLAAGERLEALLAFSLPPDGGEVRSLDLYLYDAPPKKRCIRVEDIKLNKA